MFGHRTLRPFLIGSQNTASTQKTIYFQGERAPRLLGQVVDVECGCQFLSKSMFANVEWRMGMGSREQLRIDNAGPYPYSSPITSDFYRSPMIVARVAVFSRTKKKTCLSRFAIWRVR